MEPANELVEAHYARHALAPDHTMRGFWLRELEQLRHSR